MVTGEESEEALITLEGVPQPSEEAPNTPEGSGGHCQTSEGAPTLEDHSKTQVEAAQATDELPASQETATTLEAVLVTQETSGDLCRSHDLHPINPMDDTNVTDPGNKSDPVNEANPVSEANQVNEANLFNHEANQANEANQAKQGSGTVKQKGGNSAAKGTTDTPMKGKEQEAALGCITNCMDRLEFP